MVDCSILERAFRILPKCTLHHCTFGLTTSFEAILIGGTLHYLFKNGSEIEYKLFFRDNALNSVRGNAFQFARATAVVLPSLFYSSVLY